MSQTPETPPDPPKQPPHDTRWKPGQSGNPAGRKTAGAYVKEWLNALVADDLTEPELRAIARDKSIPSSKRIAATRILIAMEIPDLADFEDVSDGKETLSALRKRGINTEVVKKIKTKQRMVNQKDGEPIVEVEREIELHNRSGDDFDRIMDRTDGKAVQPVEVRELKVQFDE